MLNAMQSGAFLNILFFLVGGTAHGAENYFSQKVVSYWRLPGYLNKAAVESVGGRVVEMPEFNSFYALWAPASKKANGVITLLPEGMPYEGFPAWQKIAREKNYLLVSILTWQGGSLTLPPPRVHEAIQVIFKVLKSDYRFEERQGLLYVQGKAATNFYELLVADEKKKTRFFDQILVENVALLPPPESLLRKKVFFLYCSPADLPDETCPRMREAEKILREAGAGVSWVKKNPLHEAASLLK